MIGKWPREDIHSVKERAGEAPRCVVRAVNYFERVNVAPSSIHCAFVPYNLIKYSSHTFRKW
jgi:hypothetical protein